MKERYVRDIVRELKEGIKLERNLAVDFGNYTIGVRTNSESLEKELTGYFREFLIEFDSPDSVIDAIEGNPPEVDEAFIAKMPEPGKTKIKEEYLELKKGRVVHKRLTGMMFFFGDGVNLAIGPCVNNPNQVINFVNNRYIEYMIQQGSLLFHSAAVAYRGKGISLAGFSGMGKSTLALHVMSRGVDFISNDRLMVRREDERLRMYGVAKYPRINPGTILNNRDLRSLLSDEERADLSDMPLEKLWELEQKYDLYIDEVYGDDKFHLQAEMGALVILNWQRNNQKISIHKIDISKREDLYPAFTKSPGLFFLSDREPEIVNSEYTDLLSDCDVFEVSGGIDFDYVADYFSDYLRESV